MSKKEDILAKYYQSELSYLRNSGMEFSRQYPKIADQLDLSQAASSDPQVERMIESFAFLTGKLQKQIHDQFPEMASALLEVIYPPLTRPTPSVSMVHFNVDMKKAIKAPGTIVPRNTQLQAKIIGAENSYCTFRTTADLPLWPLEITNQKIVSRDELFTSQNPLPIRENILYYLQLSFEWHGADPNIQPNKIRIYPTGDHIFKSNLFAYIFMANQRAIFQQNEQYYAINGAETVGINENEALFPYPKSIFTAFRLLQEYFAFPDKFYGFSLEIPRDIQLQESFSIYIPLAKYINLPKTPNAFVMHSVPAVNLFSKVSEPIRLTHETVGYDLIADSFRAKTTEIFSVDKVKFADRITNEEKEIFPFFSCNHEALQRDHQTTWYTKRKKTRRSDCEGDDVEIYFVDKNFDPNSPEDKICYAHLTCTNRHVAELMPAYTLLQSDLSLPIKKIYMLNRPTTQKSSISDGESLWKAVSMLSLNSLSFNDNGLQKIKEMLSIFSDGLSSNLAVEVSALTKIDSNISTKLYKDQFWKGFARGTEITLNFEEELPNNGIPLSFILSNFLPIYTSINTFAEVSVKVNNEVLKTWPMNLGLHNYL